MSREPGRPGGTPVPVEDLAAVRLDRLHRDLEELGCRALLVVGGSAREPDLGAFVGPVHLGPAMVLVARGEAPRLAYLSPMERDAARATGLELWTPEELHASETRREIADPVERLVRFLKRVLDLAALPPGRIALAGRAAAGEIVRATRRLERDGVEWVAGDEMTRGFRKTKDARQAGEIRHAARGVCAAFRRTAELLAAATPRDGSELWLAEERLTVGRLRREIAQIFAGFGVEQPEGNLVAPGEEGAVPHNVGTDGRTVRQGESLVVDLFPRGALWADCTRTFCVGPAPEALRRAHATVREGLELARRELAPGRRGYSLQEAVCELIGGAGYPTQISDPDSTLGYVHGLGHGVGFELHEYPSFRKTAGAEGVLAPGDVLTLEPGLYHPHEGWAVRLEDLVVLGPDGGAENLTPLPYDLDPRAWTA